MCSDWEACSVAYNSLMTNVAVGKEECQCLCDAGSKLMPYPNVLSQANLAFTGTGDTAVLVPNSDVFYHRLS